MSRKPLTAEFGIPAISDQLSLSGRTDRAILADLERFHELALCPTTSQRLSDSYLHHLPASLAAATEDFRRQTRDTLGRVEALASRIEELMGRTEATFLGGTLLPVLTHALLHQAREEIQESLKDLESGEATDVIDRADFFASALGEMAALLKILATMEIESDAGLREDWEKLADDLQVHATLLQRVTEKFEDQWEASEPPDSLIQIQ